MSPTCVHVCVWVGGWVVVMVVLWGVTTYYAMLGMQVRVKLRAIKARAADALIRWL